MCVIRLSSPELDSLMDGPGMSVSADVPFVFPDLVLASALFSVGIIWGNWTSSIRTQDPSWGGKKNSMGQLKNVVVCQCVQAFDIAS